MIDCSVKSPFPRKVPRKQKLSVWQRTDLFTPDKL